MPTLQIQGIPVDFPKDPYDCQVQYISKVVEALNLRTNALLESPTGTGKTLCLLCATLAWQQYQLKKYEKEAAPSKIDYGLLKQATTNNTPTAISSVGIIIYATRTHSQLAQVVDELKNTSYHPRMTVLGSRDQLCIHEKVSKLKGAIINHSCNSLNSRRGCTFKNNLDSFINSSSGNDIMDIEDLVEVGKAKRFCPYFYTRETSVNSEIIFMPYNYLLDSSIRKTLKVAWENAIVVFDEAHNLERVASDAASFAISSADIAACIQELQQVLRLLKEEHDNLKQGGNDLQAVLSESGVQRPTLAITVELLKYMFSLERIFDSVPLQTNSTIPNTPCAIMSGAWLVSSFIKSGFHNDMYADEIRKCGHMLMEESESTLSSADVLGGGTAVHASEPKLNLFAQALDRILRTQKSNIQDYKVYISEESISGKSSSYKQPNMPPEHSSKQKKRVIQFWCFCSGVALQELSALGVRSILLTSGTLSPMEAMKEDLRIPFPIELQNPHVIGNNQMWLAALPKGSTDTKLNSTFNNRDSIEYKDELGKTILSIYQQLKRVDQQITQTRPEISSLGGVLVFFPSYGVMDSAVERWKFTKLFDALQDTIGHVIIEPKSSSMNQNNSNTGSKVSSSVSSKSEKEGKSVDNFMFQAVTKSSTTNRKKKAEDDDSFNNIIDEFDKTIQRIGSCLLLAVCRGKVSEGIDFSDNKGRVVIITGIPFAPFQDPWVVLKKEFLDEKIKMASQLKLQQQQQLPSQSTGYGYVNNNPYDTSTNTIHMQQYQLENNLLTSTLDQGSAYPETSHSVTNSHPSNPWLKAKEVHVQQQKVQQQQYIASCNVLTNKIHGTNTVHANAFSTPSAAIVPSIPSISTVNASLSGQLWYNQSASRAVNQCLGRVIRHKNDWGVVFLLDERFSYDYQLSQLSSWMRPLVHKYNSFNESMKAFSSFLTTISYNPIVRYTPKRVTNSGGVGTQQDEANRPKKKITLSYEENMKKDPIQRFIEIDEWQLGSDDQQVYINKDLLLTQQQGNTESLLQNHSRNIVPDDEIELIELDHPEKKNEQPAGPVDLKSIINRLKSSKPTVTVAEQSVFGRTSSFPSTSKSMDSNALTTKQTTIISTGSITDNVKSSNGSSSFSGLGNFGLKKSVSLNTGASSSNNNTVFGISGSYQEEMSNGNMTGLSQFSTVLDDSNDKDVEFLEDGNMMMSSQMSVSTVKTLPLPAVPKQKPTLLHTSIHPSKPVPTLVISPAESLRIVLDTLKSSGISKEKHQEFKRLLQSIKQGGGVQNSVQIKTFQNSLLPILSELSLEMKRKILLGLTNIVINMSSLPTHVIGNTQKMSHLMLSQEYEVLANRMLEQLQRKEIPELSQTQRMTNSNNSNQSSFSQSALLAKRMKNVLGDEDIHNLGSKRAKLLLQRSGGTLPPPPPPGTSSSENAFAAPSAIDVSQPSSSSSSQHFHNKPFVPKEEDLLSKLQKISSMQFTKSLPVHMLSHTTSNTIQQLACAVCKEVANQPCAAKCGHICCQSCWLSWLKIKTACPVCRSLVNVNTVTKIVLKAN